MQPKHDLPLPAGYDSEEKYVHDLLQSVTTHELFQTLVGGVHVLDFYVNEPDLYERIIDPDWRAWFAKHEIDDLMEFFLHDDLDHFPYCCQAEPADEARLPDSLLNYIKSIRDLTLLRDCKDDSKHEPMPRHLGLGMSAKKIHEVDHFARYVQRLTADIASTERSDISHLVDFGAGQGYLGRFLASKPNNRNVVAVEGRAHNIKNAQWLDVTAKLAPKHEIWRNKKSYRAHQERSEADRDSERLPGQGSTMKGQLHGLEAQKQSTKPVHAAVEGEGSVLHLERQLENGDLSDVIQEMSCNASTSASNDSPPPTAHNSLNIKIQAQLLVMSLHSCGNLTHHALRSLTLNPSVKAVAVVGCCYNLATERLTPPTYKSPNLRPQANAANEGDPHGFPMSARLCSYPTPDGPGIRINITARMMAVQAPQNWGPDGSRAFFTRHFYRALLQRIFLDKGVIDPPAPHGQNSEEEQTAEGRSPAGTGATRPIIIGSLGRKPYRDFVSYVRAAVAKLELYGERSEDFYAKMKALTDDEIQAYDRVYAAKKKGLCIVWTLMAFSATLIEALIVVDRWLWLKEQKDVGRCWVEPVFDYAKSPRNLVVVGVKK